MEPMLYTVQEVAKILKCNPTRVYDLKKSRTAAIPGTGAVEVQKGSAGRFSPEV